jgi:hypothetical protein
MERILFRIPTFFAFRTFAGTSFIVHRIPSIPIHLRTVLIFAITESALLARYLLQ